MHVCFDNGLLYPAGSAVSPIAWPVIICVHGPDSDTWVNIISAVIMKRQDFSPDSTLLSVLLQDKMLGCVRGCKHACLCVCVRVDSWAAGFGQLTVGCDRWCLYPTIIERWVRRTNVCLSMWFAEGGRVAFNQPSPLPHTVFLFEGCMHTYMYMGILVVLFRRKGISWQRWQMISLSSCF